MQIKEYYYTEMFVSNIIHIGLKKSFNIFELTFRIG